MDFATKLREQRIKKGLSQQQVADAVGVSLRTVRNWEIEGRYPNEPALYTGLAKVLGCSISYLMNDSATLADEYESEFGPSGRRGAKRLLKEINALFAGGQMAEEDMDTLMLAVQEAYVDAKRKKRNEVLVTAGRGRKGRPSKIRLHIR